MHIKYTRLVVCTV